MAAPPRVMPTQDFGLGFSESEARQVGIGIGLMTLAFALAYIGGFWNLIYYFRIGGYPLVLLIITGSFLAVVTAFFLHELAHKAVAQRYGVVAEYRYSPGGLMAGVLTAALSLMIAFPGAVVVTGNVTNKQRGRIAEAGPVTNLAFASIFIVLSFLLGLAPGRFREPVPIFVGSIAFVNVLLAGFSLIPVPAITVRRTIAKFPVNVSVPASDGFLVLMANKWAFAASLLEFFALSTLGHLLAVF